MHAHFDLSTGASVRSYPSFGGETQAELGYNQLLWGTPKGFMFGLLRPSIKLGSSGVVNSYDTRLEFYPISFIGIAAGHENARSDYADFNYFDCENVRCKGDIKRDYALAKIALGAGPLLFSAMAKRSRNAYSGTTGKEVAEYQWAVLASPESDTFHMRRFFTGLKTKVGTFGLLNEEIRFENSDQFYKMNAALFNLSRGKLSATFGAGGFHTSEVKRGFITFLLLKYHFEKSDKVF